MHSILALVTGSLFLLNASNELFGQTDRPQDLGGWRGVKWGMTIDEARAALGAEVEPVSEEMALTNRWIYGNGAWPVRLRILRYELVGHTFEVSLGFDKGRLRIVGLSLPASEKLPVGTVAGIFDVLETQLTEKYGSASLRKNDEYEQQRIWTLTHTVISLSVLTFGRFAHLSFTYTPRGDDKL